MVSSGVITFFFTNFPSGKSFEELRKFFAKIGDVCDVFIPRKKNKYGKDFGFVRFRNMMDAYVLEEKLNNLRIGDSCIRADVARFQRRRKDDLKGCYSSGEKFPRIFPGIRKSANIDVGEQNENVRLEKVRMKLLEIKAEVDECLDKLNQKILSRSELLCLRCGSEGDFLIGEKESGNMKLRTPELSCVNQSIKEHDAYGEKVRVTPISWETVEAKSQTSDPIVAAKEEGDSHKKLSDQNSVDEERNCSKVLAIEEIKENNEHQVDLNVYGKNDTLVFSGANYDKSFPALQPNQSSPRENEFKELSFEGMVDDVTEQQVGLIGRIDFPRFDDANYDKLFPDLQPKKKFY